MADPNKVAANHFYIHGMLGDFYSGMLNWFGNEFYDRFNYRVIGTYEKSVEYFNKKRQLGKEVDSNIMPSINLDPSLDFDWADSNGQLLWQRPLLAPNTAGKLFIPIDGLPDEIKLAAVFGTFKGECEITMWMNSVYELLDMRMYLLLFSGGMGRMMRPTFFNSHIIVPNDLIDYEVRGEKIDWTNTDLIMKLLKAPNVYKYALPVLLDPMFKFTGITDNSEKYGGDGLASYKLSVQLEYEINIPTFMSLQTDFGGDMKFGFMSGGAYSRYGLNPSEVDGKFIKDEKAQVPSQMSIGDDKGSVHGDTSVESYAYYEFDEDDVIAYDKGENIVITNPYPGVDSSHIICNSYTGKLQYGEYWEIEGDTITIKKFKPIVKEIIEFHKYSQK